MLEIKNLKFDEEFYVNMHTSSPVLNVESVK